MSAYLDDPEHRLTPAQTNHDLRVSREVFRARRSLSGDYAISNLLFALHRKWVVWKTNGLDSKSTDLRVFGGLTPPPGTIVPILSGSHRIFLHDWRYPCGVTSS